MARVSCDRRLNSSGFFSATLSSGVGEALVHGVGQGRVLMEDLQIQLVRPPVAVRRATASGVIERAFRFICHV